MFQLNANAARGGVAGFLDAEIPILDSMGVNPDWRLTHSDTPFFELTIAIHNA